ncbi:protein mono-ADP-ribosyltransferase PARP9 isoform X4 [Loxodonta africana]|uniref:protein mono-ADP-ribosyltransferase PARP9 isoform X4 n=1 Tax=Loxodonta africana TaxID=9785 RepID=UPI0030D60F9F
MMRRNQVGLPHSPCGFRKAFAQIFPQWQKGTTEEIDILSANISWPISITPSDFKILKNYESQLCEVLQDKFGCVSTLVSPALEDHTKSLRVFRKMLIPGLEVSVWKDDLTTHVVDAVVNAANERLQHLGGLALALVEAGGPEIEEDSRSHIVRHGKVTTGTIAITRAGRLPCRWIIHAVGPYWTGRDEQRCVEELKCAITHILDYVNCTNVHVKAVAIPALSSGIFQFPLNLCTRIIVETIRKYFGMKPVAGNLKEIHLVSNEDPTVASFKTASENILGKNELESLTFSAEMAKDKSMLSSVNNFSGQWTGQQPKNQDERKENINPVKIPLTFSTQALQDKKKQFEKCGFQVIKVEKINNEVLSAVFQAKKKMMEGKARKEPVSHSLFQRVPRQFCNVVCRAGFQRMYQMPCDSKYGAGIYFTKNLKSLADQTKKTPATDKLIYVFEAEVLTGSFCQGRQSNIVPPPLSPGAIDSHDSVVDSVFSPETFVIFSGTQALPQYLWTCTQDK